MRGCNAASQSQDGETVGDGACDAGEAACLLDKADESGLLLSWAAAVLDLDGGKERDALAHHVGGDGNGAEADEIGAAGAEAVAHQLAVGITEGADVVAPEAGRAAASGCRHLDLGLNASLIRKPCRLLAILFCISHDLMQRQADLSTVEALLCHAIAKT